MVVCGTGGSHAYGAAHSDFVHVVNVAENKEAPTHKHRGFLYMATLMGLEATTSAVTGQRTTTLQAD